MKKYFFNGCEISEQEANKINEENEKYINSGDFEDMLKIKFIVVIDC